MCHLQTDSSEYGGWSQGTQRALFSLCFLALYCTCVYIKISAEKTVFMGIHGFLCESMSCNFI